mmetsp:Transcript_1895/g.6016  ORF Transcript_1895/g.6016 Transcript_1895/m.6016 type:complete len:216 (+) Transcript_1895:141-788(+)
MALTGTNAPCRCSRLCKPLTVEWRSMRRAKRASRCFLPLRCRCLLRMCRSRLMGSSTCATRPGWTRPRQPTNRPSTKTILSDGRSLLSVRLVPRPPLRSSSPLTMCRCPSLTCRRARRRPPPCAPAQSWTCSLPRCPARERLPRSCCCSASATTCRFPSTLRRTPRCCRACTFRQLDPFCCRHPTATPPTPSSFPAARRPCTKRRCSAFSPTFAS